MWSKRIGTALIGLIGVGISYIGIRYLAHPADMAPSFVGSTTPDPAQFLGNAKGVRDLATGVAIAVLLLARQWRVAGWFAVGGALIPAGDMVVVLVNYGSVATALGVHGAAALVTLLAGVLLLRTNPRTPAPKRDLVHA